MKEILISDIIYYNYKKMVNKSKTELLELKSQKSIDKTAINMTLKLKTTPKNQWSLRYFRWAIKTITYLKRCHNMDLLQLMSLGYNPTKS
jgi:hypothetical protein